MKLHEAGQALIESIAVLSFVSVLFIGVASAVYLIYAKQVSGFAMQKSLLCLERVNISRRACKKTLDSHVNNFLFLNKKIKTSLQRASSKNKASVSFTFVKKEFNWPKTLIKDRAIY